MAQILSTPEQPTILPQRSGTSPIGTSNPNSGSVANTNSTYAPGAFTSGVSLQSGITYAVQNTDYQGLVIFNTASAITVTLNQNVQTNFTCAIMNLMSGPITLVPNGGYFVNGVPSLTLAPNQNVQVIFANRAWIAFVGSTVIPVIPVTSILAYRAISALYTINASTDYQIECTSGTFTVTLPVAVAGQQFSIKNSGTGTITVATTSGTIDGSATQPLAQFDNIIVTSKGPNYIVV